MSCEAEMFPTLAAVLLNSGNLNDIRKTSQDCVSFPCSGVELNKPTHFTVSTKGAGKANLDCNFSGPTKGEAVKDFEVINNHDNTHTVKYTPVQQVRTNRVPLSDLYVLCEFF